MRASDHDDKSFGGQLLRDARRNAVCAAVASAFALTAAPASGLSLLEPRVHSHLGQRLVAEIPYSAAPGERLTKTCLRGGPPAPGGLPVIRHLEFFVDRSRQVIAVTSTYAIREPLASLIVEVACPGTPVLIREYTISLDPPMLGDTRSAAPVSRTATSPAPAVETASPRTQRSSRTRQRTSSSERDIEAGSHYRVKIGDSLSTIAFRVRQRAPNSTWQWAERIHALNSSAFIAGDPDRLKAGSLLEIPAAPVEAAGSQVAYAPATAQTPVSEAPAAARPTVEKPATPIHSEESLRQELALLEEQREAVEALELPQEKAASAEVLQPAVMPAAEHLEKDAVQPPEAPEVSETVGPAAASSTAEQSEAPKGPSTTIAALAVSVTGILGVLLLAFGMGRRRAYSRSLEPKPAPARKRVEETRAPKPELKPRDLPAFDDTMTVVEIAMPSPFSDTAEVHAASNHVEEDVDTQIGATPISANELQRLFKQNDNDDVASLSASQTARLPDSEFAQPIVEDTARLDGPSAEDHRDPTRKGYAEGEEPTQEIDLDTQQLAGLEETDPDADTIDQPRNESVADDLDDSASRRDKAVGED